MEKKNYSLNRATVFAIVLFLIAVLGFTLGFGVDHSEGAFAISDKALSYSQASHPRVNVDSFSELKNALMKKENAFIVVGSDINVDDNVGSKIDPFEIAGDKVLHLNGHKIYLSDQEQMIPWGNGTKYLNPNDNWDMWSIQYEAAISAKYDKTLMEIPSGASLTICDNAENKGTLHYASRFGDTDNQYCNVRRNLFRVQQGGKLALHGGNLIAGRKKESYCTFYDDTKYGLIRDRTVTLYVCGSTVVMNGGTFVMTGGSLTSYSGMASMGGIDYTSGKVVIENGEIYANGRAAGIVIQKDPRVPVIDIKISNAYISAYCDKFAVFSVSNGRVKVYDPYCYAISREASGFIDATPEIKAYLTAKDDTDVDNSLPYTSGSDAGDYGYHTLKITRRPIDGLDVLRDVSGETESIIYQHEALKVNLDYADSLVYGERNSFYESPLMKSYIGAGYKDADYGITTKYVIYQKNGDAYKQVNTYAFVLGVDADDFFKPIKVKAGVDKWKAGNYKIVCHVTEKAGGYEFTNVTNSIMYTVEDSAGMLLFQDIGYDLVGVNGHHDIAPNQSSLGNLAAGVYNFRFLADNLGDLDDGLEVRQVLMKKGAGEGKYVEVEKTNDKYVIDAQTFGYYSIVMYAQLVNTKLDQIVAQRAKEIHFGSIDITKTATVTENPNGKTWLASSDGTVKTAFKPDEKVYIKVEPNAGLRVKRITVTKKSGGNVALNNDKSFTMPDDDVTVSVIFEHEYTLYYRQTPQGIAAYTIKYAESAGTNVFAGVYTKEGYRQVAWRIGDRDYQFGEIYKGSTATALPVFEPITYNNTYYQIGDSWYPHEMNYNYEDEPYYTLLGNTELAAYIEENRYIAYYTIDRDYLSEIDRKTYTAGTKFYPNEKILPFGEDVTFYAQVENIVTISAINITAPQEIRVGTNEFTLDVDTAGCSAVGFSVQGGGGTSNMVIPANTETTFIMYINTTSGNYRFVASADKMEVDLSGIYSKLGALSFVKLPTFKVTTTGEDPTYASMILKITFYPSCGNDDVDHNWKQTHTHWCKGDTYEHFACTVCGLKKDGAEINDVPTALDEFHDIVFVDEVQNDCSQGEYSFAAHYECKDCGQCFSKPFGKPYVERVIDDFMYLHKWSDYVPDVIDGQKVHCIKCMECELVDEDSIGFHYNEDGYGTCEVCHAFEIPCEHSWTYNETLSTCALGGSLVRTCEICGSEETELYAKADHTLVYVEAVKATCIEKGTAAHYKCTECGRLFDVDVYKYIKVLDGAGLRFIRDIDDEESEYKLTVDFTDLLNDEADGNYKYEDELNPGMYHWDWEYIKEHSAAYNMNSDLKKVVDAHAIVDEVNKYLLTHDHDTNTTDFQIAVDPNNHVCTEIRNALPVTVNADGYTGDLYCIACDKKLEEGEVLAKHIHKYGGTEWTYDDVNHWHICNAFDGCTEELDKVAHTFGEWHFVSYANEIGKKWQECSVCGHVHVEDYVPEPVVDGNNKKYTITEGLQDIDQEEGKDVRYIFDLAGNNDGSVTFETEKATIIFDKDAVKDIAGHNVKFKMTTSTENLGQHVVENAQMVINLSLNGITFENGKATVTVPIDIDLPEGAEVKVYYVNGAEKEDMKAVYANGEVTFETNHFSEYVIAYETPLAPGQPGEPEQPEQPKVKGGLSAGAIAGIVVGCVVFVAGVVVLVLFLLKKKKKGAPAPQPTETSVAPDETTYDACDDVVVENSEVAEVESNDVAVSENSGESESATNENEDKEGVIFREKKLMTEEYSLLTKEQRKLFDAVKAYAMTLPEVRTSEAQDYYTVLYKKEKLVRLKIKKGDILVEFFANDKEFKEIAGTGAKETASSTVKVRTEEDVAKAIEIIDYKYKAISGKTE